MGAPQRYRDSVSQVSNNSHLILLQQSFLFVLKFEESLRKAEGLHPQAEAEATLVYFSSRMEAVSGKVVIYPRSCCPDLVIFIHNAGMERRKWTRGELHVDEDHRYDMFAVTAQMVIA